MKSSWSFWLFTAQITHSPEATKIVFGRLGAGRGYLLLMIWAKQFECNFVAGRALPFFIIPLCVSYWIGDQAKQPYQYACISVEKGNDPGNMSRAHTLNCAVQRRWCPAVVGIFTYLWRHREALLFSCIQLGAHWKQKWLDYKIPNEERQWIFKCDSFTGVLNDTFQPPDNYDLSKWSAPISTISS